LVKIAVKRDKVDAAYLQQLRTEYDWPDSNQLGGDLVTPWGMWCESVCQYIEGGPSRLAALATGKETCIPHFYFSVSVLTEIKTKESVAALCKIAEAMPSLPIRDLERPVGKIAEGFNLILCLKGAPEISATMERRVRNFLHAQLTEPLPAVDMASVFDALRGVGDSKSVTLLETLADLPEPFDEDRSDAIAAIKKRRSGGTNSKKK
tara:strand:- start:59 stop:679 length:621 start_codon:yes stop_codon:yes gene_type:complete